METKVGNIEIHIDDLFCGGITLKFIVDGTAYPMSFDEALSDPFPYFANTYQALLRGRDVKWGVNHPDGLGFRMLFQNDHEVEIKLELDVVDTEFDDGYIEKVFIILMSVDQVQTMIDNLFKELLNAPDFPCQFPLCSEIPNEQHVKIEELADEIYNYLPENLKDDEAKSNQLYIDLDRICGRHLYQITQDMQEAYDDYMNMLTNYEIPKGWKFDCEIDHGRR